MYGTSFIMLCFKIFNRYSNTMNFFVRKMLYTINLVFEVIFIKIGGKSILARFLETYKLVNE